MTDTPEYTIEWYDGVTGSWFIHESSTLLEAAREDARQLKYDLRDNEFAKVRIVTTSYEEI